MERGETPIPAQGRQSPTPNDHTPRPLLCDPVALPPQPFDDVKPGPSGHTQPVVHSDMVDSNTQLGCQQTREPGQLLSWNPHIVEIGEAPPPAPESSMPLAAAMVAAPI